MIKVGLDLAFRTCGIAILGEDKLSYDSKIIRQKSLSEIEISWQMTEWIFEQLKPYLEEPFELVLEDIFKGRNFDVSKNTARTQGAVVDRYIQLKGIHPKYVDVITARTKVGVPVQAPKVAIQLWAMDTFKLGQIDSKFREHIEKTIEQRYQILDSKEKRHVAERRELKVDLNEYSKRVATMTGVDEHSADAIVLTLGS